MPIQNYIPYQLATYYHTLSCPFHIFTIPEVNI